MTEADFEKRLRELMKPVKAEWEEHLAEVTGPQVDEVHKAEEQLAKYMEGDLNPGERDPEEEEEEYSAVREAALRARGVRLLP